MIACPIAIIDPKPLTSVIFWTGVQNLRNTNGAVRMHHRPGTVDACCKAQVNAAYLLGFIV